MMTDHERIHHLEADLATLQAENERLRSVLERVRTMVDEGGVRSPDDVLAVGLIVDRALANTTPPAPADELENPSDLCTKCGMRCEPPCWMPAAAQPVALRRPGLTHQQAVDWILEHEFDTKKDAARALILLVDAAIEADRSLLHHPGEPTK